jgi:cytochrome bd-type quinol oxidase subunit 1
MVGVYILGVAYFVMGQWLKERGRVRKGRWMYWMYLATVRGQ